jgi:hypothetical protein
MRRNAADVAVERQAASVGGSLGHGHAGTEDRVGPEPRLVGRPVELDHRRIDVALVFRVQTQHRIGDLGIGHVDRLEHALAKETSLVAIAQFDRFMRPCGGPRGHRRPSEAAVFQQDVDFDRGITAGIEDFASVKVDDGGHGR